MKNPQIHRNSPSSPVSQLPLSALLLLLVFVSPCEFQCGRESVMAEIHRGKSNALLLTVCLLFVSAVSADRIYGNYCGPDWCEGRKVDERDCGFSAQSVDGVDACCFEHDRCCGSVTTYHGCQHKQCDKRIVDCLVKATCSNAECEAKKPIMVTFFESKQLTPTCCGKASVEGLLRSPVDYVKNRAEDAAKEVKRFFRRWF